MLLNEITKPRDVPIAQLAKQLRGTQNYELVQDIVQDAFPEYEVNLQITDRLESGQGTISAVYEPEDDSIELDLVFSDDNDTITWSKENRVAFLRRLQDSIKHELVHRDQYSKRPDYVDPEGRDKRDSNYEYMSRDDEIEAYAVNIADELVRKAGKDGAMQLLRIANKTAQFKDELGQFLSPDLFAYMSMWDFDSKHPVLKRLLKKVFKFINER